MTTIIVSGLVLGMFSSFHCVGMCGPLALALPVTHMGRNSQLASIAVYNLGRVVTYAALGLLFGIAGRKLFVAGWQQAFSITAGAVMLLLAFQYFIRKRNVQPRWMNGFHRQVQKMMQFSLRSGGVAGMGLLGMANGLLPCGMVYLAIAGALNTTAVSESVLFMSAFGFGTMPAMIALAVFGTRISTTFRYQIRAFMPYVVACFAVLLILRGLNLGIPFISPELSAGLNSASAECH